jgi:hypothetical protein
MIGGAGVSLPIGVDVVGVHGRGCMLLFRNIILLKPVPTLICSVSFLEANLTNRPTIIA